jgi:hypothetical protein
MTITELSSKYSIIPKTIEIMKQTKESTNKNIDITITDRLRVDGLTKIARSTMDKHYIFISQSQLQHINYLLVHECGHIKRIYDIDITDRKTLKSDAISIMMIKIKLLQEVENIPIESRNQVIEYLVNGLISQLFNAPIDVLIEQWIYTFKELRNYQTKYLRDYSKKILKDITAQAQKLVPYSIFIKSNSMNYAYLKSIGSLMNVNFSRNYTNGDITQTGEKLFLLLNSNKNLLQDIQLIDQWAEVLNMKVWYYWDDFENIPENYLEMNV